MCILLLLTNRASDSRRFAPFLRLKHLYCIISFIILFIYLSLSILFILERKILFVFVSFLFLLGRLTLLFDAFIFKNCHFVKFTYC